MQGEKSGHSKKNMESQGKAMKFCYVNSLSGKLSGVACPQTPLNSLGHT